MPRIVFFLTALFLFCFFLFAADTDFVTNITYSPSHRNMNLAGQVAIKFDLPRLANIDEAYLEIKIGSSTNMITIPGTQTNGDDLDATENTLTITGAQLDELLTENGYIYRPMLLDADDDIVTGEDTVEAPDEDAVDEDAVDNDTVDDDTVDEDTVDNDAEKPDVDLDGVKKKDGEYSLNLVLKINQNSVADNDTVNDNDYDTDNDVDTYQAPITNPSEIKKPFTVIYDNTPPAAPTEAVSQPGNKKIQITVTPSDKDISGGSGEHIGKYFVIASGPFMKAGVETQAELTFSSDVTEANSDKASSFTISGTDGYEFINNDNNNDTYKYSLKIYAADQAGNSDPTAFLEIQGIAMTTEGFWNHYKNAGGKEKGGFCFIATAGYGSYFHPFVKVLRDFRDTFLMTNESGRRFVAGYYHNGPAVVELMNKYTILKPVARVLLMPLVIVAYILLSPVLCALFALFFIGVGFYWFRKKMVFPFILLLTVLPLNLHALSGDFSFNNSLYNPENIDKSATGTPFHDIAGSSDRYLPSISVGLDIPAGKYLKLTARGTLGFTYFDGKSILANGTESIDDTSFYMIPASAELKLRPVYKFPVYPYVAVGPDYIFWWITESGSVSGYGGTAGFHGNFGVQVSLNWIEPKVALKFRETTGITDTALYVHYRVEMIDEFGSSSSFDLSMHRFEFGIIFDF